MGLVCDFCRLCAMCPHEENPLAAWSSRNPHRIASRREFPSGNPFPISENADFGEAELAAGLAYYGFGEFAHPFQARRDPDAVARNCWWRTAGAMGWRCLTHPNVAFVDHSREGQPAGRLLQASWKYAESSSCCRRPRSASYGYGTGSEEVLAEILARIARRSRVIRFPALRAITEA